jgi:hypothetical protein
MGQGQGDRDPVRAGEESRAAEVGAGAAVTAQAPAAPVFVQAAAKKRRTGWESPVLI